jgi:3'-phosphoadenosine 5'-phosphosulfate sulfotransferase (PAPS reductase)/FAD synthetase
VARYSTASCGGLTSAPLLPNHESRHWRGSARLEYRDDERGFAIVDYETASRNGQPFEDLIRKRSYLPNPVTRFCTIDLKIRVIHKYLRMVGCSTEETPVDMMTGIRADEPRRVAKIRHRKTTSESKHATMVMPLADAGVIVQDVTDFWKAQPFDLMLPTVNGRTLEGNCDLCFPKGAKQVYSIIASDRRKAEWWARMERTAKSSSSITGDGALFRFDRPSYQQMLDYSDIQIDMFADHDETIAFFCGD